MWNGTGLNYNVNFLITKIRDSVSWYRGTMTRSPQNKEPLRFRHPTRARLNPNDSVRAGGDRSNSPNDLRPPTRTSCSSSHPTLSSRAAPARPGFEDTPSELACASDQNSRRYRLDHFKFQSRPQPSNPQPSNRPQPSNQRERPQLSNQRDLVPVEPATSLACGASAQFGIPSSDRYALPPFLS